MESLKFSDLELIYIEDEYGYVRWQALFITQIATKKTLLYCIYLFSQIKIMGVENALNEAFTLQLLGAPPPFQFGSVY